jgi:clan AA aspartic protease
MVLMGLTTVRAKVGKGRQAIETEFLVDSGATYTLLPRKIWKALKLKPIDELDFALADSTVISRKISEVWLELQGKELQGKGRTVPVILGERGDEALLGAFALEAMGLILNPFTRQLTPMKLMLA